MTCLLYGIVFAGSHDDNGHTPPLVGVGGALVRLTTADGLGAAISMVEAVDLTPNVERALSFANVVGALHAQGTVLPMRYGCVFRDEGQVVDSLREGGENYRALLRALDGCIEMGVGVLLPTESVSKRDAPRIDRRSGRAYLVDRAAWHARESERARTLRGVVGRLCGALGGLVESTRVDRSVSPGRRLASVYFLVKRTAVDALRQEFRRIERKESVRLLLSGPWPPYNFAAPAREDDHRD